MGTVESQHRGSLQLHLLAFDAEAPSHEKSSDDEVVAYMDRLESTKVTLPDIPGIELNEEDRLLPLKRQIHKHKKTCYRGSSKSCRFGFDQIPMPQTMVLRPFPEDTPPTILLKH